MTLSSRFVRTACLITLLFAAGTFVRGDGASWPANVRVNQDHDGNPQAETSLAVDPRDPLHLVAVFWEVISYDPQNTSNRQKRVNWAWTRDGGQTWQSRRFENGVYSSDPAIAADNAGNFYIETILVPNSPYDDGASIGILKSTDGGETFVKTADVGLNRCMDKPFLTVDPVTGAVYVVWIDFAPKRAPNAVRIFFSMSVDHGDTFTPPRQISAANAFGSFPTATIGPAGEVYVAWATSWYRQMVWLARSLDGGRTWELKALKDSALSSAGDHSGDGALWATVDVDRSGGPHHGRIYMAWIRYATGKGSTVDVAWSDDRGDHWSEPVRADGDTNPGDFHVLAWVVVDGSGRVCVTYRLLRPDPAGFLQAEYLAVSTDGGARFGPNVRVSEGITVFHRFNSDYDQPAAVGNRLHAIWTDARLGDNDIFTQNVNLDDFDEDGILNDGDLDGEYADHPCTGGAIDHCDDNCPGTPNADQADADNDGIGDACEAG